MSYWETMGVIYFPNRKLKENQPAGCYFIDVFMYISEILGRIRDGVSANGNVTAQKAVVFPAHPSPFTLLTDRQISGSQVEEEDEKISGSPWT